MAKKRKLTNLVITVTIVFLAEVKVIRQRILRIFTRDAHVVQLLWEIREQRLLSITRTVTGRHGLLRLK